jgi:hypothetical protein
MKSRRIQTTACAQKPMLHELLRLREGCAHVSHRNEYTPRIVWIPERPEAKIDVELPALFKMLALKNIKNNCRCAHLLCDSHTPLHGVEQKGRTEAFPLHVQANGNGPNIDDRNIRYA